MYPLGRPVSGLSPLSLGLGRGGEGRGEQHINNMKHIGHIIGQTSTLYLSGGHGRSLGRYYLLIGGKLQETGGGGGGGSGRGRGHKMLSCDH